MSGDEYRPNVFEGNALIIDRDHFQPSTDAQNLIDDFSGDAARAYVQLLEGEAQGLLRYVHEGNPGEAIVPDVEGDETGALVENARHALVRELFASRDGQREQLRAVLLHDPPHRYILFHHHQQ